MPRFDLLQVQNLLSWEEHLRTLLAVKPAGRLRYVGPIAGFIGACILIAIARAFSGGLQQRT